MAGENPSFTVQQLLDQGRAAYNALRLEEALASYQQVLALQPTNYEAHLGLARTLSRMRRLDEAHAAVQRCLELDPQRAEGYAALGMVGFLRDQYDQAAQALTKAIELSPEDPEAHLTLAQVYADMKKFTEAWGELEAARDLIAALPSAEQGGLLAFSWHVETYLKLAEGRTQEAMEAAQEVLSYEDANPHAAALALANLGILEARARHYDLAIEYLERAYQLDPFFYRAGSALGRLLIIRGQAERAAQILGEVVAKMPGAEKSTRYAYALALNKAGRRQEALAQYRQALQEGLTGIDALAARWQVIWLSPVGRYVIVGLILAAVAAWLILAKPSPQSLTLMVLLVVILLLQRAWRSRR